MWPVAQNSRLAQTWRPLDLHSNGGLTGSSRRSAFTAGRHSGSGSNSQHRGRHCLSIRAACCMPVPMLHQQCASVLAGLPSSSNDGLGTAGSRQPRSLVRTAAAAAAACPFPDHHAAAAAEHNRSRSLSPRSRNLTSSHGQAIDLLINLKRSSSSQDPSHPLNPSADPTRHHHHHHHHHQQQQQQQHQGFVGAEAFLYPEEGHNSWQISTQIRHSVEEAIKAIVHIPGSSSSSSSKGSNSSSSKWQGLYQIEWQEEQQRLLQQQQHQQQLLMNAPQQQQQQHFNEAAAVHDHICSNAHASSSSETIPAAALQSPHALTRKIQACEDANALEQLLQKHLPQLDHIHVATAFVQLARLQRSSSSSSSGMSADMLQQLQQLAADQLPLMQSRHISNILWAAAVINLSLPQACVEGFMSRAQELFSSGTAPQGFANTIWAVANLRVQPSKRWMDAFFTASQPHLHNFQSQELSSTIWALGSMTVQPPAGWQYSFATASTAKMGTCTAQSLSNMLWAVAKLGLAMPEHWTAAVTYAAQLRAKDFSPLGLSNLLWAAAKLHGKQRQQLQWQRQQQQHGSGSHVSAGAVWGQQVTTALGSCSSSNSSSMGRIVTGSSSSSSTSWLQLLLTAATPHVQHFNAHCLSNVIWALSVLEHSSSPEFVQACADQLMMKSSKLSSAGAASAVWGLARFGVLPRPEQQMAPLLRLLEAVLPQSNPHQLVYIAAAMACIRQQQQQQQQQQEGLGILQQQDQQLCATTLLPPQLLQQYLAVCQSQLHQFAPGQLCELGHWLAAAAVQPNSSWTDEYLSTIAQQLNRLKQQHHIAVLKTLGLWKVQPHPGWTAMFTAAVVAEHVVRGLSAAHIGALLQGFAAAAVQPQQQQLELLLQQVLVDMSHSSNSSSSSDEVKLPPGPADTAAAVAGVLQGLCRLGFRPAEPWLRRFWDNGAQRGFAGADPSSLAALAAALQLTELGELRIRPSKPWGSAYHAAVAAVLSNRSPATAAAAAAAVSAPESNELQGFTPRQAAAVLAGLATVKLQPKQPHAQLLPDLMAVAGSSLPQLSYGEAVAAWWALVEFGVLVDAVPLHILQQQPQEVRSAAGDEQGQQQQQQCHWLQHLLLSSAAEAQLAVLGQRGLLQLAACLARLQQPTPCSWGDAYITAVSAHIPQLQPQQLVFLLCAMPTLSAATQQETLTTQLLSAIQPHLSDLSPKQLSDVLVRIQQSGVLPPDAWLTDYVTATSACLPDFLGRQLVRVLTSLARLRFSSDPGFLEAASDAAVDKLGSGVPAAMLVDLLWALTMFHRQPTASWLARFEARLLEKGPDQLDGAQLSRLGWCWAALQVKPGQLLMVRYMAASGEQLHTMAARSLADILWACAMLNEKPNRQWLDNFVAASRKHLPVFPGGALVTVMWALAMLQHRPPTDWMTRCLTAIGSCLEAGNNVTYNGSNATSGLRTVSATGLLQRPQLPGTAGWSSSSVGGLNPSSSSHHQLQQQQPLTLQQVTRLAWALAVLDCKLPTQLLQQLLQRAESQIAMLDSDSLAQLVWSLDRLDDTQEKLWVRRFAAAARAHLVARPPRTTSSSGLASAAAGFRPSGLGIVVRNVAVGQQQQQRRGVTTAASAAGVPNVSRAAAAAAAAGVVVQKEIAEELHRSGMTKQGLLAKLRRMKQQSE